MRAWIRVSEGCFREEAAIYVPSQDFGDAGVPVPPLYMAVLLKTFSSLTGVREHRLIVHLFN